MTKNFFQKTIDKIIIMWYNIITKGKGNPKHQKGKNNDKLQLHLRELRKRF